MFAGGVLHRFASQRHAKRVVSFLSTLFWCFELGGVGLWFSRSLGEGMNMEPFKASAERTVVSVGFMGSFGVPC